MSSSSLTPTHSHGNTHIHVSHYPIQSLSFCVFFIFIFLFHFNWVLVLWLVEALFCNGFEQDAGLTPVPANLTFDLIIGLLKNMRWDNVGWLLFYLCRFIGLQWSTFSPICSELHWRGTVNSSTCSVCLCRWLFLHGYACVFVNFLPKNEYKSNGWDRGLIYKRHW